MGTFYIGCRVQNHVHRDRSACVSEMLVDTGSEFTWIYESTLRSIGVLPEKTDLCLVMANGETVTRSIGFAILYVDKAFTIDEVVFAQEGDMQLLGARSLEGLNLRVDPRGKKLVAAGPIKAALSGRLAGDCPLKAA